MMPEVIAGAVVGAGISATGTVAEQVVEGAQYGSYKAITVTSILFDGNQILGSSGTVKQCFYGSYKNMLNSNFKIGTCKTIITTGGITIKNIFAHANEEECPQKRGDKEWRTGALLLSQ